MAPTGLAVIIGAGPATGAGMARVFADPQQGNMAVALLARRPEALAELATGLRRDVPAGVFETFTADAASPGSIDAAFRDIAGHASFSGLKLRLAVYSVKHSSKKPFMDETYDAFTASLQTYAGGAFAFAQAALRRFFADHGDGQPATGGDGDAKGTAGTAAATTRGTLIFTGTLGALRCSANFAAYGAGRAAVRQLAQSLAREMSARGVHVVHTVANGPIVDDAAAASGNAKMAAESVGRTYLWLAQQPPDLWTHELDMRPAAEKF